MIRPIPPLAWIPLAILWLGLGDAAKIMVIWFSAFVPSVINSFAGVRNIDRPILEAAAMLGTPRWRMVREIIMPAASPMIFTGLRLSLQASWTTLVAAELVGALVGVGFRAQHGAAGHLPRHDPGRDGDGGHSRLCDNVAADTGRAAGAGLECRGAGLMP